MRSWPHLWLGCLATLVPACSGQVGRSDAAGGRTDATNGAPTDGGPDATSRDAHSSDASPGSACSLLDSCLNNLNYYTPAQGSGVVASGNSQLCTLALNAIQYGQLGANGLPETDACGSVQSGENGFPPPTGTGSCAELYSCCSDISESGGSDACLTVALEAYPSPCASALTYFHGRGYCRG